MTAYERVRKYREEYHDKYLAQRRAAYRRHIVKRQAKGREYAKRRRETGKSQVALKKWRRENKFVAHQLNSKYHHRAISNLSDSYIRMLLKRVGITRPTADQIERRRAIISAKRFAKTAKLIHAISFLCKP